MLKTFVFITLKLCLSHETFHYTNIHVGITWENDTALPWYSYGKSKILPWSYHGNTIVILW